MTLTENNRLAPSQLSREDLDRLSGVVLNDERPKLIGREGVKIDLPDPVFHLLVRIIRAMREGQTVVILPEKECFTTQAAANFLGVSRPYLITLLDKGEIIHHKTGTHRRVYLKDLLEYQKRRDASRRKELDVLFEKIVDAGLYDKVPSAEGDAS